MIWRDRAVVVVPVLVVLSILTCWLLWSTTPELGDADLFDSPWYWWTWLGLPAVAGAVGLAVPRTWGPAAWAATLIGPLMLLIAYGGTVGHDPANGASLWIAGEVFLVVQGALIFWMAKLGSSAGLRIRS